MENSQEPNIQILKETQENNSIRLKIGLIVVLIFTLIGLSIWRLQFTTNTPEQKAVSQVKISGIFNINGIIPQGATIALAAREKGSSSFSTIESNINPVDGASWNWAQAKEGSNYDLQAYLQNNGQNMASSEILTITAPASQEILSFNIKVSSPSQEKVTISGIFDINGYIPSQSTITLTQSLEDDPNETIINEGINSTDGSFWSWNEAIKGNTYKLKAYLKNQGKTIGKSAPLTITAPAVNEVIIINSIATPPNPTPQANTPTPTPPTGALSGSINLNGPVPANTRIVIFERISGTNQFQVAVDNLTPTDGTTWSWTQAQSGTTYELLAILKQKQNNNTDQDLTYSQRLIANPPAANEIFTINTGVSLPPPSSTPNIFCNNQINPNQWSINLTYSNIQGTNQYWAEIGSQPGGNDVLNYIGFQSNNNPQSINANINNNTTYYARYAYANCSNCTNSNNFSGFSNTLSFSCPPQSPTPTPTPQWTGYVCNLGTGCQLTKDPNPPYAFSNAGLQMCQANCIVPPTPTNTPSPTAPPTPTNTPVPTPTDSPTPNPTQPPVPTN